MGRYTPRVMPEKMTTTDKWTLVVAVAAFGLSLFTFFDTRAQLRLASSQAKAYVQVLKAELVEPLETTPWAAQSLAYRLRVDVAGATVQRTDVHVIRDGPAIAVVQVLDQADAMAAELPAQAVRAVLEGMVSVFGQA